MRITSLLTLFALLHLGSCAPNTPQARHEKPRPPIQLEIEVIGQTTPGHAFSLEVSALPEITGDIEIEITLPPGVTKQRGEILWKGRLLKNQRHILRADLISLTPEEKEILITAVCTIDSRTKFTASDSVLLQEKLKTRPGLPKVNSKGEKIRDFPQK